MRPPTRRAAAVGLAAGTFAPAAGAAERAPARLRSPYKARPTGAWPSRACPRPTEPVKSLVLLSAYPNRDYTRRDEALYAEVRRQTGALTKHISSAAGVADLALLGPVETRADAARCLNRLLESWAVAEALLGQVNRQGEYQRTKTLGALSLCVLKARAGAQIEPSRVVQRWLGRLSTTLRPAYASGQPNNLHYWAALAATASAAVLQDRSLHQWGRRIFTNALAEVDAEGFLPRELKRGEGALAYHAYAVAPLMLIAAFERANGADLSGIGLAPRGPLRRLADLTLAGYGDPTLFGVRAGATQAPGRSKPDATTLAWLPVYDALAHDLAAKRMIGRFGPYRSIWLGGDTGSSFR